MTDIDLVFENKFKIAVLAMHINGSYPSLLRTKLWFIHSSFVFFINACCFYLLSYSVFIHDIRNGNFTDACKNISMIVICMNTTIKYLVLLYHRESVLDLIRVLDDDYEIAKQLPLDEQCVVKQYAREGYLVCVFWSVCASSASIIFPLKAFILTVRSYQIGENKLVPMFDVTFPATIEEIKDSLSVYWTIFALCFVFAFFAAVMYTGFDPLIPIFTLHTCGQLDLLGTRISTALSETTTLKEKEANLKKIIIKLQSLYRFIDQVKTNFTVINELNMKTTTILLPLVSFHIVEDLRYNVINCEFFILFIGATLHFLMPCYFSDFLMERSAAFRQAIYSCGWEKHPDKSIRQTVLLMLTRASRPLGISTVFYDICLDTFSAMIRQSYSLFNLMNAAWGK